MQRYYCRITAVFYTVWLLLFILEGMYAATLPTRDLTTWFDTRIPVLPEFVWVYVSCYVFPLVLLVAGSDWHRFNVALAAIALCTLLAFIGHIACPVAFQRPVLGTSLAV